MLKHTVENLESINENHRDLYEQGENGYSLKVDLTGSGYEKVDGLKSALEKIKTERNGLRADVDSLSKYRGLSEIEGFDPANVADLMAKAEQATDPDAIEKINRQFEKKIEGLNAQVGEANERADQADSSLQKYIISKELLEASLLGGVMKDSASDAVQLTIGEFRYVDGKVIHVDADGDPTGLTPSEFFTTANKEKRPYLYGSVAMSGSGSTSSVGKQNASDKSKPFAEAKTTKEKVAALTAKFNQGK